MSKCPKCGASAYQGLNKFECSTPKCGNYVAPAAPRDHKGQAISTEQQFTFEVLHALTDIGYGSAMFTITQESNCVVVEAEANLDRSEAQDVGQRLRKLLPHFMGVRVLSQNWGTYIA